MTGGVSSHKKHIITCLLMMLVASGHSLADEQQGGVESDTILADPYTQLTGLEFWRAVRRDSMGPSQMSGATGSFQYPSPFGPFRSDLEWGRPDHAYSPFQRMSEAEDLECGSSGCGFHADRILVRLKPDASLSMSTLEGIQSSSQEISGFLSQLPIQQISPVFPRAKAPLAGATVVRPDGLEVELPDLTRWFRIDLEIDNSRGSQPINVSWAVSRLRTLDGVDYAEPDYQYETQGQPDVSDIPKARTQNAGEAEPVAADFYDDPQVSQQWHLNAVRAPAAWQYLIDEGYDSGGSSDVVVAVLDSGVDYTHPDLAASMWVNPAELTGESGVDSDGNGYVDDIHGASVVAGEISGDPMDYLGHGTHVAGIIAAQGNNDEGGVGVAPNVKIMAIKAGQYGGILSSSDLARGVEYAIDNGADVINMSFGGYYRSQILEDALANAFGFAVLVAAAGNNAKPTLSCPVEWPGRANMYPGAYNWTLGVKALAPGNWLAGWSNFDCVLSDISEYELAAPGAGIFSTVPFGGYGVWSGTSMAAPVVSAMAAMARTIWNDKSIYSSRFIMGQVASTGPDLGFVRRDIGWVTKRADAELALSTSPQPELHYLEHWIFDTKDVDPGNDADGVADAGEIVEIGVVIRNQWGKASNVTVKLDAWAPNAAGPDPYIQMLESEVNYGDLGSFNNKDNGFILDDDGAIIGVEVPFSFTTDPDAPNDHWIPFRLTMTAENGYDSTMPAVTRYAWFYMLLQRGRELPRIISEDMVLTNEDYWLVPDAVLIEEGATVTVTEGAQLQFFSIDPKDPYADQYRPRIQVEGEFNVVGSPDEPVEMFTGVLYEGFPIEIQQMRTGNVRLSHARILNPVIGVEQSIYDPDRVASGKPLTEIKNSYFTQEIRDCIVAYSLSLLQWSFSCTQNPTIRARTVKESKIYNLGYDIVERDQFRLDFGGSNLEGSLLDSVLFKSNGINNATDTVFLKNYRTWIASNGRLQHGTSRIDPIFSVHEPSFLQWAVPLQHGDKTYVAVARSYRDISGKTQFLRFYDAVDMFAQSLGGHLITVNSEAEDQVMVDYYNNLLEKWDSLHHDMDCRPEDSPHITTCFDLFRPDYLIGLIDRYETGDYRWTSGEDVAYSNWANDTVGYPNSHQLVYKNLHTTTWRSTSTFNRPFFLELPGVVSGEALDAARAQFFSEHRYSQFQRNAFLNDWVDPDISHWMRIYLRDQRNHVGSLANNFWGTTSKTKIDAAIFDFNDNFNYGTLEYEPMLTVAPETAYPFVADIQWETEAGLTEEVGVETVDFLVHFNRDMDTSVDPMVSFGPAEPYTDFVLSGAWDNARTWRGQFDVNPITGDGWQYMRVIGAVAADNAWLKTGNDYGRFRFLISTSGTASMSLQASGGEGQITLSWMQTDYETVAGYHIYRAPAGSDQFERINPAILSQGLISWADKDVLPGQTYHYYFTVIQTDQSESEPSNIAVGSALDTMPPEVTHSPISEWPFGQPVTIRASVTDNVRVDGVSLYFRTSGQDSWQNLAMALTSGSQYSATISGSAVVSPGVEYYIEASDGINISRYGRPDLPQLIQVDDLPLITSVVPNTGPAKGGTSVIISGSNFQPGATATIGSVACSSPNVVSDERLECVTGANTPGPVDVRVQNPSGESGLLLNGFSYQGEMASLGFPVVEGSQGSEIQVPLTAADFDNVGSVDLEISYDPTVLTALGVQLGNLAGGWFFVANTDTPGTITVSMAANSGPVSGSGNLLMIRFALIGAPASASSLTFVNASLNEGAIATTVNSGSISVESFLSVSGAVTFWNNNTPVPETMLTVSGDSAKETSTTSEGAFSLEIKSGDYIMTPSRSQPDDGISAFDASLILQHSAKLSLLSGVALEAADVNQNGTVSAFDAFLILQYVVGLTELPFSGAGKVWAFEPSQRNYNPLASNQSGQNFTAILLGDPSGSWVAPEPEEPLAMAEETTLECKPMRLDTVTGGHGQEVLVALRAHESELVAYSLEFTLTFDPLVAQVSDVQLSSNWAGAAVQYNEIQDGVLRVAIASAMPLALSHSLANVHFVVGGNEGDTTEVQVSAMRMNEQSTAGTRPGSITVGMGNSIFRDRFGGSACW